MNRLNTLHIITAKFHKVMKNPICIDFERNLICEIVDFGGQCGNWLFIKIS